MEGIPEAAVEAWVLEAADRHDGRRALKAAIRAGVSTVVPISDLAVCVLPANTEAAAKAKPKVERKLGHPVETRVNCSIAHYPTGSGFVVLLIDPPASPLDIVFDSQGITYRDVIRPFSADQPIRACVPRGAIPDLGELALALEVTGIEVLGTWEVGACRR